MCQDQKASLKKEWKPSNDMRNNYCLGTAGTTDTVLGTSLHFPAPSTQALRPLWIHTLTITAEVISPPEVTRKPRLRKKKTSVQRCPASQRMRQDSNHASVSKEHVISTVSLSLQRTAWNVVFCMNSFFQRCYNTVPDFKNSYKVKNIDVSTDSKEKNKCHKGDKRFPEFQNNS